MRQIARDARRYVAYDHVPWNQQDSSYRARTASVLGGPSAPLPVNSLNDEGRP